MDDIPDPAAHLAAVPAPEVCPPDEPSLTRLARERRGRIALATASLWVVLVAWTIGLRGDLERVEVVVPLALWTLLAGFSLLFCLRSRARGLPAGVRAVQAIVVAIPLGFMLSVALATSPDEPSPAGSTAVCVALASGIALAPLALAALVLWRSFLSAPAWRGAAIGVVCGLSGTVGIHAHCPSSALFHVALGHGLPIALGALLGAVAGALRGRA
jgi:hypothetical protein